MCLYLLDHQISNKIFYSFMFFGNRRVCVVSVLAGELSFGISFACSMHIFSIIIIFVVARLRFKYFSIHHSLVMVWFFFLPHCQMKWWGYVYFGKISVIAAWNFCNIYESLYYVFFWLFLSLFPFASVLVCSLITIRTEKNVDKWENMIARMMLVFDSRLLICYLKHPYTYRLQIYIKEASIRETDTKYVCCLQQAYFYIYFYMLVSQRYIYLIRICHKHRKSNTLALEMIFFSCSLFFFYIFVCRVKFYEDSSFCTAVSLNSIDCINFDARPLYWIK